MKTFKEYLNENAIEAGQKDIAIADSVTYLSKELRKLFPEEEWNIRVSSSPMNGGVAVDFYNSSSARNNIRQNSSTFMQFMMHLTGKFGQEEDLPTVSWEQINTNAYSVKFRKINSKKSTKDANFKLVDWFKKNKESIYALEGPNENLNENLLDEAATKINTRTWNIHKATVANLKQELLKGSNSIFAERVKSIVKQEVSNYGWNITCLMDDGNKVVFAIQVKELDVSMI